MKHALESSVTHLIVLFGILGLSVGWHSAIFSFQGSATICLKSQKLHLLVDESYE